MEKIKQVEYFTKLVDSIGTSIVNTKTLHKIISEVDNEFGYNIGGSNKCRPSRVTNKLVEILGDSWIEIVKDETAKKVGKGNPRLFSLKLRTGFEREDMESIRQVFIKYYTSRITSEKADKTEHKEPKEKSLTRRYSKPRENMVKTIYNLLVKVNKSGRTIVPFSEISDMVGRYFSQQVLDNWKNSLLTFGVNLDAKTFTSPESGKQKCVRFNLIRNTILLLSNKSKEWYGKDLGAEKELGLDKKMPIKPLKPDNIKLTSHAEELDQNTKYTIYAIGGILKLHGKAVGYDVVCRDLSENFGIMLTKTDLRKLANEVPEFDGTISFNNAIKLTDLIKSWDSICEKYNPRDIKQTVIARINMSHAEVCKFIPETEVLSVISDTDAIYRITYDRSIRSFKDLIRLYRTFRGTDKILDNDSLVEKIEREIVILDSVGYSNKMAYQIEMTF